MKYKISTKPLSSFFALEAILKLEAYGSGHINDTYRVETTEGDFILQKVNKEVFDTVALVHNYELLNKALEQYYEKTNIRLTPKMLTTATGAYHFVDQDGCAWRKVAFLPGSKSYDITTDPEISFAAAAAYGKFQLFLNTLDAKSFQDTIPQFHHPENRMKQFETAKKNASAETLANAETEIAQVEKYNPIVQEITQLLSSGKLPRRLSHYDTKLNNVIFYTGRPYVIDLDTVMQGTVLFDFGDMVRTFTSPAAEDEPNIDKTIFRMEHFEALTKGYFGVLKNELSALEKENLLLGVKAILYEQVLRFLSDFLNGNVYYKVAYPEHNLIRSRTQLKLLEILMENESRLINILHNVVNL